MGQNKNWIKVAGIDIEREDLTLVIRELYVTPQDLNAILGFHNERWGTNRTAGSLLSELRPKSHLLLELLGMDIDPFMDELRRLDSIDRDARADARRRLKLVA